MKDYFDHNDAKGRDSRVRTQINHSERAKAAIPFEGTLCMSKYELRSRRAEGTVSAYGCTLDAGDTARTMRANDHYARNFDR